MQKKTPHVPAVPKSQPYVQTERAAHQAWGKMCVSRPAAGAIMHALCSVMDKRTNGVVITQKTLADWIGIHVNTVKSSINYLVEHNWIQRIQLGGRGTVNAYVINSRVAWADNRGKLPTASFHAQVIADRRDQDEKALGNEKLRMVPLIHPPEEALPSGEWPEGEQGYFDGLEPVAEGAPYQTDLEDFTGEPLKIDRETGEIIE